MYSSRLRISEGGRLIGISSFVGTQFTSWNFFAWITRTSGNVANRDLLHNQGEGEKRKVFRGDVLVCDDDPIALWAGILQSFIPGQNFKGIRQ